ncbi:DUF2637 domain-containing protein [Streptomyces sp. NPDC007808]|uniref:DUF2637 domain-containing protein n=1 Tax=Streptomyces sp. NPDC007808 TaxID=3364779 RepID=UPI0036967EF9
MITTGAVLIAAIGFTGSYTAVRDLALAEGFGTFSYLFPIGIDAGIVVLLALDLQLTWIRIPYPLLRHTAWLLTFATIAFNAATAWPDPLGVSMHAVIPLLFVIAVEAARHAIGRIAHLTADTHMDPIRPARWLLSPLPTFLLWRRMKLWELRSYHQAISLEQQRLLYQARLRTRYGRGWRRKAPTQALTPLRLARYGIPLPAHPPGIPPTQPHLTPTPKPHTTDPPTLTTPPPQRAAHSNTATPTPSSSQQPATTRQNRQAPHPTHPTSTDTTTPRLGSTPSPTARPQHDPNQDNAPAPERHNHEHKQAHPTPPDEPPPPARLPPDPTRAPTPTPPHPHPKAKTRQHTHPNTHTTTTAPTPGMGTVPARHALTAADHYYLAWHHYQQHHGKEPDPAELSTHLAHKGIYGRDNQPVKPKTLARYTLQFRIYTIWAKHRALTNHPSLQTVAEDCASHGITGQYNKPLTPTDLKKHLNRFQHRWHTLNPHTTNQHHPPTPPTALNHRFLWCDRSSSRT